MNCWVNKTRHVFSVFDGWRGDAHGWATKEAQNKRNHILRQSYSKDTKGCFHSFLSIFPSTSWNQENDEGIAATSKWLPPRYWNPRHCNYRLVLFWFSFFFANLMGIEISFHFGFVYSLELLFLFVSLSIAEPIFFFGSARSLFTNERPALRYFSYYYLPGALIDGSDKKYNEKANHRRQKLRSPKGEFM